MSRERMLHVRAFLDVVAGTPKRALASLVLTFVGSFALLGLTIFVGLSTGQLDLHTPNPDATGPIVSALYLLSLTPTAFLITGIAILVVAVLANSTTREEWS